MRTRADKQVRIGLNDYLDAARSGETEVGTSVEEIVRMYLGT